MFRLKLRKKLNKIYLFFKKLPRFLAENAFFTTLIFILLALILGSLVFYQYSFLVEKKKLESSEVPLFLNEKTLQEIIKIWQEKEKKFREAELKTYPDPFYKSLK